MEMLVMPFNRAMNLCEEQIQGGHPLRLGCDVSQMSVRHGAGDRSSWQSFKGGVISLCWALCICKQSTVFLCCQHLKQLWNQIEWLNTNRITTAIKFKSQWYCDRWWWFPRRKVCFPILHLPFILVRLSELFSFEPSGPCSPLLHPIWNPSRLEITVHLKAAGDRSHKPLLARFMCLLGHLLLDFASRLFTLFPCYSSWSTAGVTSLLCFSLKASSWLTFNQTMSNVLAVIHRVTICHGAACAYAMPQTGPVHGSESWIPHHRPQPTLKDPVALKLFQFSGIP